MDVRFDTAFESSGGFSETMQGEPIIHGRLSYDPIEGIQLELVVNPRGAMPLTSPTAPPMSTFYGQLVDGAMVTLEGCVVVESSLQIGIGIGSPTTFRVSRALFGCHVAAIDCVTVKTYSMELSSLTNWTCTCPLAYELVKSDNSLVGVDASWRIPDSICVSVPEKSLDIKISHHMTVGEHGSSFRIGGRTVFTIIAPSTMVLETVSAVGGQYHNMMSLLVGHQLGIKSIQIEAAEALNDDATKRTLQLLFQQRSKYDQRDLHPNEMLLPYKAIQNRFAQIVAQWSARSEQSVLAMNVFFGSQYMQSPPVNVKFLAIVQAAESYHRSLDSGLYMPQEAYDEAIQDFSGTARGKWSHFDELMRK